jgi:putative transposase
MLAVGQEASVQGVGTRRVDQLVEALGLRGLSKSQVSRICGELDRQRGRVRKRLRSGEHPSVWRDAKAVKVRQDGRVVNMAAVIAEGVRETGPREVLGFDVGAAETDEFWLAFLRHLVGHGVRGMRLVISDAHQGLRRAVAEVLAGASWQRCRGHFLRNLLARVPKQAQPGGHPGAHHVRLTGPDLGPPAAGQVAGVLQRRFPQVAALLREAADDVLASMAFPLEPWRQVHSTNVLSSFAEVLPRDGGGWVCCPC